MEQLGKGHDPSRTLEENPKTGGREALRIIKQWEQTPEGQRYVQAGESASIRAKQLGFNSVTEYQQVQQFAGRPTKQDLPLTPAGVYQTPSGLMSIDPKQLEGGVPPAGARYVGATSPTPTTTTPTFDFKQYAADYAATQTSEIPKGVIPKTIYYYGRAERKVSSYIPTLSGLQTHFTSRLSPEARKEFAKTEQKYFAEQTATEKKLYGIGTGYYSQLQEKPVAFAATTAAFTTLPVAISGIGKVGKYVGAAKVAKVFPKTTARIGTTIKIGLPAAYGTSVVIRTTTEGSFDPEKFGRIAAAEITPMATGTYFGSKALTKYSGWWRTRGRTEISTESLIPESVLKGGKKFPTAPASMHKKLFLEQSQRIPEFKKPTMYHATGEGFWKKGFIVSTKKTSEFRGLYGSYGVSPHFLRIKSKTSLYGGKFFQPYEKPSVLAFQPKGFVEGTKAPEGYAFIPKIKPEVEAVYPPTKGGEIISKKYFFKYKETRVPIDVGVPTIKVKTKLPKDQISKPIDYSSYGSVSKSYIITPSSLAIVSAKSLISSSKVSAVSSSKIIVSKKKYPRTITPYETPPTYYQPYKTRYKITPTTRPPTYYPPTYYPTTRPPKRPPVMPPIIRVTSTRVKTTLKPQLKPQPKKYQASLRSKALGIYIKTIPTTYKIGAGGIATRPIIVTRKKIK